jgi:hypothetical protein
MATSFNAKWRKPGRLDAKPGVVAWPAPSFVDRVALALFTFIIVFASGALWRK